MKRSEIVEAMARAIRVEMGPVFGTPEYLARPGNVGRLEARQQSAADKWAEAALTALEASGLAVVSETRLRTLADVVENHAMFSSKDRVVSHVVTEITAMLSASKDDPNV